MARPRRHGSGKKAKKARQLRPDPSAGGSAGSAVDAAESPWRRSATREAADDRSENRDRFRPDRDTEPAGPAGQTWWARREAVWQIHASGALFGLGTIPALAPIVSELSYHTANPMRAPALAGASLCAGVILGLWGPREFLIHRLRSERNDDAPVAGRLFADGRTRSGADTDAAGLAATLVGGLFVVCGTLLLILLLAANGMETFREHLRDAFVFPAPLTLAILWTPAILGLVIAGAVVTLSVVALHGWLSAVRTARPRVGRLWAVMIGSAALGVLIGRFGSGTVGPALLAVLPVFAAALLTTMRIRGGESQLRAASRGCAAGDSQSVSSIGWRAPLAAYVSAMSMAWAGALALADANQRPVSISLPLGITCAAVALAGLFGQWLGRALGSGRVALAMSLLASAGLWILPLEDVLFEGAADARLAAATLSGGVTLVLAARRVSGQGRGVQFALAVVGAIAACGFMVSFLAFLLVGGHAEMVRRILGIAIAGCVLPIPRRENRGAVAVWSAAGVLVVMGVAGVFSRPKKAENFAAMAASETAEPARRMWGSQVGVRAISSGDGGVNGNSAWQCDLSPDRTATLVCARQPRFAAAGTSGAAARRFVRRCANAVVGGGRVVFEQPDDALADAAISSCRKLPRMSGWSAYVVVSKESGDCVLAVGSDIPAWVRGTMSEGAAQLRPVRDLEEMKRAMGAD